jgi:hypothetical protein
MSEWPDKSLCFLRRHDMQEVELGCDSVAKRYCPIGAIYALYGVVEMNVDSLLLCQS